MTRVGAECLPFVHDAGICSPAVPLRATSPGPRRVGHDHHRVLSRQACRIRREIAMIASRRGRSSRVRGLRRVAASRSQACSGTGDARVELAAVHPVTSRLLAENGQRQHRSRGDSDAGGRCRHYALRVFLAGTARLRRSGSPGETATGVRPSGRRGTRPGADPGLQGWSTSWAPCRDPTSFRRSAHGT